MITTEKQDTGFRNSNAGRFVDASWDESLSLKNLDLKREISKVSPEFC